MPKGSLPAERLKEQESRVRPAGGRRGGIARARSALIRTAPTRHVLGLVRDTTTLDDIDPLSFGGYFARPWNIISCLGGNAA